MRTSEQIRVHTNNRVYPLVAVRWGGSITAGVPRAVVNTVASYLAGEASLMISATETRRPEPDMFPGVVPGARIYLEVFVDDEMISSTPFLLSSVVITENEARVEFTTNSLTFSNPVRLAPVGEYMPQGWGRGDGDSSQRWASSLGTVSPGASPGWVAFWGMRVAGFHCVPPLDAATTMVDVPMQWTAITDEWHMNGGHTISCHANDNKLGKSTITVGGGMTYMSSGQAWYGATIEGRRNWGKVTELSGHFMWGPNASAVGEFTIVTGGGNWVSFNPRPDRGLDVHVSKGEGATTPAGVIPDNGVVQCSVSTTKNRWRCKVGAQEWTGTFYAVINDANRETKETWFTGLIIRCATGSKLAGCQVRTGYQDKGHYLDNWLQPDGKFPQTAYIDIPLSGLRSRATPSVRDTPARDLLDDLADSLCASWWVDEAGVCQFRDARSLRQNPRSHVRTLSSDASGYQLVGEDTVARDAVTISYDSVSYSRNQQPRINVYEGRGATISRNDEHEELITPENGEDWLSPDWSLSWYNKWASPAQDLSASSWVSTSVKEGKGSTRQNMQYVNPWTYIYRAWVTDSSSEDFSAQYEVDGTKFPLIRARGLMQFTETSKQYGRSWATAPFVHEAGQWVTETRVADNLGNFLLELSSNPIPMRSLTVFYAPDLRLGDVVTLLPGEASNTVRTLQVTQISHDPANLKTDVQVIEIRHTAQGQLLWEEAERNARRAGNDALYRSIEQARAGGGPTWETVQAEQNRYPYGV